MEITITQQEGNTLPVNMKEVVAEVCHTHKEYMIFCGHDGNDKINAQEGYIPEKDSAEFPTSSTLLE